MTLTDAELIERALAARGQAYAPYSTFTVGCALIADATLHTGVNVENASYGLSICAERSAIVAAIAAGCRSVKVVVVATDVSPPAAPCGMCLQTIHEFADPPASVRIILVNPAGERRDYRLDELFPHGFSPAQLPRPGE